MARIYIIQLNKEIKKEIEHGRYSLSEIKHIRDGVSETVNRKNKVFRLVRTIFCVIAVVLSCLTIIKGAPIMAILIVIPVFVITLVLSWLISVGNLKIQFNRAVKKGYPDHVEELYL